MTLMSLTIPTTGMRTISESIYRGAVHTSLKNSAGANSQQ